jgi:inward rectifier potassium channel
MPQPFSRSSAQPPLSDTTFSNQDKARWKAISNRRLVDVKGHFNIIRRGTTHTPWRDLYHLLLTLSWIEFLALIGGLYLVANALFAFAYLAGGNHIQNARPGSFADAFFFSVQTMASIGYGAMYPIDLYGNLVVTAEALVGLMGLAMATGLVFARFSRPTAQVMFSQVAVIEPYNGVPTLMFRAANQRQNRILDVDLRMVLVQDDVTLEGHQMRRFYDLNLLRSHSPIFALTWMVMHPMTPDSPLYGWTHADLVERNAEIVVTLTGLDETLSQTVHARHSFVPDEILWNVRFVDIFSRTPEGRLVIDYHQFHNVHPL